MVLLPRSVRERPEVALDPRQRAAVGLAPDRSLLVLGEAGHGKTTVAMHRLAHLVRQARGRFRAAVIVPAEGLARMIQPELLRLGVDVNVRLYDRWAARQARRAFGDIPRRESKDNSAAVIRVKRDRALALAVAEIAARDPGIRDDDTDAAPVRSRAFARRADLQHLFGDRALLERVVGASEGRLHARMIEDVLGHSFVQFSDTAEKEFAHVDKERLVTVDGLSIDEGTAMGDARTIDAEDYAVLFEIDRLRAQARGGVPTLSGPYDCIVLDEAQELAPLELALIGRSARGTIIVAGDADQQTDATVSFEGWDSTMRALGVASYETATLEIGYRCPPDVVAFARSILAGRAAPCTLVPFDSERALGEWLAREIAEITHNDRQALLGVVCRHALTARRIKALVGREARIVWDGRFPPAGAFVTTVDQVKGLELDHVVVPDANAAAYPDEPAARRALYVAATRARHQLVLAAVGASSPILGTSRTSHM